MGVVMRFFKYTRYALFALFFSGTLASYPISLHVMRSPEGRPVVLLGDIHYETEGLLVSEQEVLDFIHESIDKDFLLDLIWECREYAPERYRGVIGCCGKLATEGHKVLIPDVETPIQNICGMFEISNQVIGRLLTLNSSAGGSRVTFYPSDARAKRFSARLLRAQSAEAEHSAAKRVFEEKADVFSLPQDTLSLQDRHYDLFWKCEYLNWAKDIESKIHILRNTDEEGNRFADYAFWHTVLKTKKPAIVYAGGNHIRRVVNFLKKSGYQLLEEKGGSERPFEGGIVDSVLRKYLSPNQVQISLKKELLEEQHGFDLSEKLVHLKNKHRAACQKLKYLRGPKSVIADYATIVGGIAAFALASYFAI
jgi:hypothetical protein